MSILIEKVLEEPYILDYLVKRGLLKQYKNKKELLISSNFAGTHFKLRHPKKEKIWYFRINKQFRALGYIEGNVLKIFDIDNHQN